MKIRVPMMTASQWCKMFGVKWDEDGNLHFVSSEYRELAIKMAETGFNHEIESDMPFAISDSGLIQTK